MAIDPICKKFVGESPTALSSQFQGKRFYFCSPGCKSVFDKAPGSYAQKTPGMSPPPGPTPGPSKPGGIK